LNISAKENWSLNVLKVKRTHIWQDRQTDRYTNRHHTEQEHQFLVLRRDRQTDRQTYRHTDIKEKEKIYHLSVLQHNLWLSDIRSTSSQYFTHSRNKTENVGSRKNLLWDFSFFCTDFSKLLTIITSTKVTLPLISNCMEKINRCSSIILSISILQSANVCSSVTYLLWEVLMQCYISMRRVNQFIWHAYFELKPLI